MNTLYLDCAMGAAGDMLTAALLELLPEPDAFLAELNGIGLPGVRFAREPAEKCGIRGTHIAVTVFGETEGTHPHGAHHHLSDIAQIVEQTRLSPAVRRNVLAVYDIIAQAESQVHGVPVEHVHFHEVGALDALADISAVCMLLDRLAPDEIVVSPVHVGCGQVRCAHGLLPVPAPATALLLQDVPIYGGSISGELCTPTGAALLRRFATRFGAMPIMRVKRIGYGMGTKDFEAANCVRALWGVTDGVGDTVTELRCNLDDMTAESIGFAVETLLSAGALDVYTAPIGMKKSRPGTLLCVLCHNEDRERMVGLLFRHTTTLGIRESHCRRHTLRRSVETLETSLGTVRRKCAEGYGVRREKYEYDDLAAISRREGLSLDEIRAAIERERTNI